MFNRTAKTPHVYSIGRGSDTIRIECRCPLPDTAQCSGASDQQFHDWLKAVLRPGHKISSLGIRVWLNGEEIEQF